MDNLRITTVQSELYWEDPQKNREGFEVLFSPLINKTDLVILPEMFTTGFTMNSSDYAEPPEATTFDWLKSWSIKINAAIMGSYIVVQRGYLTTSVTIFFL